MLLLISAAPALAQQCLSYEPAEVNLAGRISRRTFPGPPNYQSIRRGDRPETSWVLHLSQPVCVTGNTNEFNEAERRVTDLQLILEPEEYKRFSKFVGTKRSVIVSGMLTHAQTGHHHTSVLMDVSNIKNGS
jgi:hypothetical protein